MNGQRTDVLGANFVFRAVPVRKGLNLVRFEYRPWPFWPLLMLSWSLLSLILAGELFRVLQRKWGKTNENVALQMAAVK